MRASGTGEYSQSAVGSQEDAIAGRVLDVGGVEGEMANPQIQSIPGFYRGAAESHQAGFRQRIEAAQQSKIAQLKIDGKGWQHWGADVGVDVEIKAGHIAGQGLEAAFADLAVRQPAGGPLQSQCRVEILVGEFS